MIYGLVFEYLIRIESVSHLNEKFIKNKNRWRKKLENGMLEWNVCNETEKEEEPKKYKNKNKNSSSSKTAK